MEAQISFRFSSIKFGFNATFFCMKYNMAVFNPLKLKSSPGTLGFVNEKAFGFPNLAYLSTKGPPG
ncbi:hypothetical protein D3C78_1856120 [compost metagenome]